MNNKEPFSAELAFAFSLRKRQYRKGPETAFNFNDELTKLVPALRSFARSLCQDISQADNLVYATCEKAVENRDSFKTAANLRAWVFAILKGQNISPLKTDSEVVVHAGGSDELEHFQATFAQLEPEHREVLTLVVTLGISYKEVAFITGCPVGTIKSRVNRARRTLEDLLELDAQ